MSQFHERFGFYLDGVDENTARMPPDWLNHAETMEIDVYGRTAVVVCPCIEDVIVAKLHRLAEKDLMRRLSSRAPSMRWAGASDDTIQLSTTEPIVDPMKPPRAMCESWRRWSGYHRRSRAESKMRLP